MRERERRVFVPKGGTVRLVLEGGAILDISHPSLTTPFRLEQKSVDSREAQREQLKAQFPDILFPYTDARLTQHGHKLIKGGEKEVTEMMAMETEGKLREWMQRAKVAGISNQEIRQETTDLLSNVVIDSPRIGEIGPLIKGVRTEVSTMVDEVWGVKNKKTGKKKL